MDESTTRALLTRVLAEAPPPAPVDLDRVAGLAEAYRRRRARWVVAAAAALVLVVTVAVAALATSAGTDRAAPPASRPPGGTPAAGITPRTAPAQFDPAHSLLQVSGAPTTLTETGTSFSPAKLVFYGIGGYDVLLQAMVGAKGQEIQDMRELAGAKVVAGPAIHHHPSRWYELHDASYVLRWQWAPGALAFVAVRSLPDPLAVATRAASSITVDLSAPTRLPFTLRAPSGFRLQEFQTDTSLSGIGGGNGRLSATVAYGGPGTSFVSVNANLLGSGIGKASTTYKGRPVRVTQSTNGNGVKNAFIEVVMAASDLKVTGNCNYQPNPTITLAQLKTLCIATTASVKRVADLRTPTTWPAYSELTAGR